VPMAVAGSSVAFLAGAASEWGAAATAATASLPAPLLCARAAAASCASADSAPRLAADKAAVLKDRRAAAAGTATVAVAVNIVLRSQCGAGSGRGRGGACLDRRHSARLQLRWSWGRVAAGPLETGTRIDTSGAERRIAGCRARCHIRSGGGRASHARLEWKATAPRLRLSGSAVSGEGGGGRQWQTNPHLGDRRAEGEASRMERQWQWQGGRTDRVAEREKRQKDR